MDANPMCKFGLIAKISRPTCLLRLSKSTGCASAIVSFDVGIAGQIY